MNEEQIRSYYERDVGEFPVQVEVAAQNMPEALSGYMAMRMFILSDDVEREGSLPKRYVNLLFTVLDVSTGNLPGAKNHARASLDAGLHWHELMQAMVQVWIVCGFASAWGTVGYQLVEHLKAEGFGLDACDE